MRNKLTTAPAGGTTEIEISSVMVESSCRRSMTQMPPSYKKQEFKNPHQLCPTPEPVGQQKSESAARW
jgi:hypothetical protein